MCIGGDLSLIADGSPLSGSSIWGQVMGKLGSVGIGGQYLGSMLAGAREGNTDWIAHAKSEFVELTFESGKTVTMSAADMDSAVLAAYGYSYNSVDGLMSTRGFFDDTTGLPSGPAWTLKDGVLTRPSTTSVTGEVLGNTALEIPSGALAVAASGSVLANDSFGVFATQFPDERLASKITVPNTSSAPISGSPIDLRATQVMDGPTLNDFLVDPSTSASAAGSGTNGSGNGATAAPSSGSLYTRELAEERARAYSEGVAQADAAQQAEYTANRAAKIDATQARIDQNMSQSEAASAKGAGAGPAVPAAPGYGPGDVLASGQVGPGVPAAPGYGPGDVASSGQPGIFARQGFSNDGRIVPNIFKVINQDLWTGWEKSSGAEAVLTYPFVLAMSGAVLLPQSINDIPNIPSLLATALTEWDHGNWGKAAEAAGDGFAAMSMLGELAEGIGTLRSVSGSEEMVSTGGTAMSPRVKFRQNPPGTPPRNLEQAKQIAEKFGIDVDPERYLFVENPSLPADVGAAYKGMGRVEKGQMVEWSRFKNRNGQVIIEINPNIYGSDDLIIGTFAHEINELELLEAKFHESGGRLEGSNVRRMIDNELHPASWTHADAIVEALQKSGERAWP